jgi:signal transduction histidine kinase
MSRRRSLSTRLILSSAVISIVMLVAAGLLLGVLFRSAVERNFDARLRAVLDGLLNNVEVSAEGVPQLISQLADTRFTIPFSGWYWQVSPAKPAAGELPQDLASESLLEQRLQPAPQDLATRDKDGIASFYVADQNGVTLRAIEQVFTLPGSTQEFSFLVAGNFDELRDEVRAFQRALVSILALLGAGLLGAIFVQVKYGLRPLQRLQSSLTAIREGKTEKLEGEFPGEIQPVADELNLLIESNAAIIDRARTQVGNLAHALKTPLSVLTNEANLHKGALATKVMEQTQVMGEQVSLYLDRARRAARAQGLGAVTEVLPLLEGLARTLQRIHRDKGIEIKVSCAANVKFRGERQDFEEMAGNLLDNASKWATGRVAVTAEVESSQGAQGRPWLVVTVDDDGPGLPASKRAEALKRGRRLDETKPGSGLGLSIVTETASMYGGGVELDDAAMGGLRVRLRLPAAA